MENNSVDVLPENCLLTLFRLYIAGGGRNCNRADGRTLQGGKTVTYYESIIDCVTVNDVASADS